VSAANRVGTAGSVGVVWFRRDLRLDENPAWAAATSTCATVVPLFVLDERLVRPAGEYRRNQLFDGLRSLDAELADRSGGRLHVRTGDPRTLVASVVQQFGATELFWNEDVTPYAAERDEHVRYASTANVTTFYGSLVHAPGTVLTNKGTLSRVFTPFYKAWKQVGREPWPSSGDARCADDPGDPLPPANGDAAFPGGAPGALDRLEEFLGRVDDYTDEHDRMDHDGTSRLSTDLRFGTISPRTLIDAVGESTPGRAAFVRQLAWRDWYAHLLAELPSLVTHAMRDRYDQIAWRNDPAEIEAWKSGRTGIPVVDAGMRQLLQTGWMHNRTRMICGSFLVKNLLVDWRVGERHFRHLLVDGDVPQNVGNWQWVAGTGPDAAAYNRIFNPVLQSRRFDPDGDYIRRWVPELRELDADTIHAPWELASDGLFGPDTDGYPPPIVDLAETRAQAIAAYAAVNEAVPPG
jgi:deoxyribodipyrimidine photo-lyase